MKRGYFVTSQWNFHQLIRAFEVFTRAEKWGYFLLNPCVLRLLCLMLRGKTYFIGKSVVLHLLGGPVLRTHHWEDREDKKVQYSAGFEPMSSLLQCMCSTAALQSLSMQARELFLALNHSLQTLKWALWWICKFERKRKLSDSKLTSVKEKDIYIKYVPNIVPLPFWNAIIIKILPFMEVKVKYLYNVS